MSEEIVATVPATSKSAIQAATTIDLSTREGIAKAFNAGIAGDHKVEDCIGQQVAIVDFYVEAVDTVDEKTGEPTQMPHVVLFADNGETYEAFSVGMYSSVRRLAQMMDSNGLVIDYEHPLTIEFAERKARMGKMYYFKIVA